MPFEIGVLNGQDRVAQKEQSRAADLMRLAAGEISRDDLMRQNGFFSSLPIHSFRIVAIGGRPVKRAA